MECKSDRERDKMRKILPQAIKLLAISFLFLAFAVEGEAQKAKFKALVLAERGGDHEAF
jgi:hypothetical protein